MLRRLCDPGFRPFLAVGLLGLASLLLVPATATARPPASPAPQMDTAKASGETQSLGDFTATEIEVDAHSGPSGENPDGSASFVIGGILPISGPVVCLDVSGNTALLTVAGPFASAPHFASFILRLVDNGGSGLDSFEYFTNNPEVPEILDCRLGSEFWFGGSLIGRALVSDVDVQAATPTSKRECRRGGFADFGFKNQGRCVRYVVHHRRSGA